MATRRPASRTSSPPITASPIRRAPPASSRVDPPRWTP
jgi:hypothetical protein